MRDSEVAARPPAAVRVVDPAQEGALAHHLLRAAEGGDVALGATQYAALMGMVQRSSSVPSDALPPHEAHPLPAHRTPFPKPLM